MRRLAILFVALVLLAGCEYQSTDDDAETTEPAATATEEVAEDADPTPTQTAVTEQEPTAEPEPSPTGPADEPTSEPQDLQERVDMVAEQVVELRGLELDEELDFSIMNREELEEMLQDEVELEERDVDLYWVLRLIEDRDIDLEQLLIDAQAADIYGLYDPETQETYVIAEDQELGVMEEVFLAHEIVHALQDQHFDLGQLETLEPDYDRLLAFQAMVEGDALLSQQLYVQQYLSQEELLEYQQEAIAAAQNEETREILESLPRYFLESLSVPYTTGLQFMMQTYDGDYDEVNAALEDPPISAQQVLNPADYRAGEIEDPVEIDIADPTGDLDGEWEEHRSGTFGVFDLRIMLEENGVAETEELLDAWRGSVFAGYADEDDVLGILETRWETEEDATAFEDALVQTMADYDEEDGVWIGEERYHTISSDGDAVALYSSTDLDALVDEAGIE